MKNKIAVICSTILVLSPYVAKADIDVMSFAQDQLTNYQKVIDEKVSDYIGYEMNLQELVNSRDVLGDLKNKAKGFAIDAAMKYGSNIKIRSMSLGGLKDAVKGSTPTPLLAHSTGKKMSRDSKVAKDSAEAVLRKKKLNRLQVENVSTMFAKALVARRAIINEEKQLAEEEKTEPTDLTQVLDAYKKVSVRADGRWKSILDSQSNHYGQLATIEYLNSAIEKIDEENKKRAEEDKKENEENKNGLDNTGLTNPLSGGDNKGMSLTDMYNKGSGLIKDAKDGNWDKVASGALGNIGDSGFVNGQTGNILKDVGSGITTVTDTANRIERGDDALGIIGGVVNSAGNMGSLGEGVKGTINNIGTGVDIAGSGRNTINSVSNGDISGALNGLGDMAGGAGDLSTKPSSNTNNGTPTSDTPSTTPPAGTPSDTTSSGTAAGTSPAGTPSDTPSTTPPASSGQGGKTTIRGDGWHFTITGTK